MKLALLVAAAGALALSACATPMSPKPSSGAGVCNAEPGRTFVGQKADAAAGVAIRRATGSGIVRWAPPRSAVTMDYQEGRVTIAYDDAMIITAVMCG